MRDGVLASRTLRFVSILRAAARIPLFQSERCARSHLFALLGLSSVADAASLKQRKAAPGYFAQGPTERIRIDETGRTEDYHLYHGRGGGATARIRHSGPHTLYAYTFFFSRLYRLGASAAFSLEGQGDPRTPRSSITSLARRTQRLFESLGRLSSRLSAWNGSSSRSNPGSRLR